MIILISGEIGVGKSSVCREIANKFANSGGVICLGKNRIIAYDLSSKKFILFAEKGAKKGIKVGRYTIYKKALNFSEKAIAKAIKNPQTKIIFIDEIGPLEFSGHGLFNIAKKAFKTKKIIIVIVRKRIRQWFINRFPVKKEFKVTKKNRINIHKKIITFINKNIKK